MRGALRARGEKTGTGTGEDVKGVKDVGNQSSADMTPLTERKSINSNFL